MINSVSIQQSMLTTLAGGSNPGRMPAEEINSFEELLKDKEEREMTAKEYLATLTTNQLYIIQTAQRMAVCINADKLSVEGAENLFVPLGDNRKYVDLNDDGITEIGEGKVFVFPPPNAPDAVKDAWDEVTGNMTFKEKMLALSPFMAAQIEANAYQRADGSYEVISPGAPGYINIFGTKAEDYCTLLDRIIERLTNLSKQSTCEEKERFEYQVRLMNKFMDSIIEFDAKS